MKNMISLIFVFIIILLIPVCACAKDYSPFTDTSGVSDETFFGKWDSSSKKWTVAPQLDYDKHSGLSDVESSVKNGDYTKAKENLLTYYKNREGISFPKTPQSSSSENTNFWALRDSMAFTDSYITNTDITSDKFVKYTIDLGTNANGGRFLLSSLQKSSDMIEITSRESDNPPLLVIKRTNGETITITPEKDTYIRAGAYKNESYGSEKSLYIKDDYTKEGEKYIPFSDNTRRTYMFFDNDKIPSSGIASVSLVINARLTPESGKSLTDKSINLVVINPYNKSWNEYQGTSQLPLMTWANYKVAHYSWQGLPGGILWEKPDNSPSEYFNANTRFTQMSSLASLALNQTDENLRNEYMHKSMELTLDFIGDTVGKIGTGVPNKRDIESANRCHEFSALYKLYLDSGFMTPDANAAMLKWLYQEAKYLYEGAGILYTGANAEVTANNYANTNRGAWHTMGFLACVGYFPEFKGTTSWNNVLSARIQQIVNVIIADDGCYLEPTFGYPGAVINFFNSMMNTWRNIGKEPDEILSKKLVLLARYLMYTAYPNGNPPRFGENFSNAIGTIKSIVNYEEDPEVVYFVTSGAGGTKPATTYARFDLLKIATDRTGWTSSDSMIFMNAKNGGNHNHKDSLSLTMYSGGREVLEDTGMTSYDSGYPAFDWQRHQTKSHNTVEIDGKPQRGSNFLTDNGDSDIDIKSNSASSFVRGWTDATEGFRHKRNVLWLKNLDIAVVNDDITAPDTEAHTYAQNWHVYSGYSANPFIEADFTGKTAYESGTQLIISQADKSDMTAGLEKGYSAISSDMTDYFNYKKTVNGDGSFSTVIVPVKENDKTVVKSDVIKVEGTDGRATRIELDRKGETYEIVAYSSHSSSDTVATFGDMSTDCNSAYAIFGKDGAVSEASIFEGKSLYGKNGIVFGTDSYTESAFFSYKDGRITIECSDADKGFIIGGYPDAEEVYLNGELTEFSLVGDVVYANFGFDVDTEYGGAFGEGRFFWSYDSSMGILRVYGSGALDVYNSKNYTSRPWNEYSDEIEYLILDNKITSSDMYAFCNMPLIDKVWCSESFFDFADGSFVPKTKFAGNCTYICSTGTGVNGSSLADWQYEPIAGEDGFFGILTVTPSDKASASVGWDHIRFDTLNIYDVDNIRYSFESDCLERVYISGVSSVGESAFYGCPSLCEVVITEGTLSIGNKAFALDESSTAILDIILPASLENIDNIFEGRKNENIQLYGYPSTEAEDYAKNNSLRFEFITEGGKEGLYSWSYDESTGFLKIDFAGDIPSKLSDEYKDISTTYEPYASVAEVVYLGRNVTSVSAGLFDKGNVRKVYCPYDMFNLTYKAVADVGDAIYKDENGNEVVYPATVVIDGKTVPTHNAAISKSTKTPFAGAEAKYKAANGTFVSYSKTSSPYTIVPNCTIEWEFDPSEAKLIIDCISGNTIGNVSVRTASYYPWNDVSSETKKIEFSGEIARIGKYAFSSMAIEELDLPDTIVELYMRSFQSCKKLRTVHFGNSIEKLDNYCFSDCSSLETVFIPDSVSFADTKVFYKTGAQIICNVGSYAANVDFYNTESQLNSKHILSSLEYDNGTISIVCGSDGTDKLIKAYYSFDAEGNPVLSHTVIDDVKLTKGDTLVISDSLDDAQCDFVKLLLARGDNLVCPDSKSVEVRK